jgi:site-specific recombinase XerD
MQEVSAAFARMSGTTCWMVELIYGRGMRIHECMTLRVKGIDFDLRSFTVRAAKGNTDRATLLPEALIPVLHNHLTKVAQFTHLTFAVEMASPRCPMPVQKVSFSLQVTGLAIGLPFNGGSALAQ